MASPSSSSAMASSLNPPHSASAKRGSLSSSSSPQPNPLSLPSTTSHSSSNTRSIAEMTRAEAIGLYRSGNISSLPPSTSSSHGRDHQSVASSRATSTTSTNRRPRAGTMPSSFASGASPLSHLINQSANTTHPEILRQLNLLSSNGSLSPNLPLHAMGSSGLLNAGGLPESRLNAGMRSDLNLQLSLDKTRARAGTVALPPSSASSYFGRGVFSTNFVPRSSRMNEELRSIRSDDSASGEVEDPDEAGHVRTLDYLGLDADSPISPTVSNQPKSAFVGSGFYHILNNYPQTAGLGSSNQSLSALANRMRASTISGMAPSESVLRRQSSNLRPSQYQLDDSHYSQATINSPAMLDDDYSTPLGSASQYVNAQRILRSSESLQAEAHEQQLSAYSALMNSTATNGLLAPINRPRANTLGGASLLAGMSGPSTPLGFSAAAAAAAVRNRAGTLAGFPHPSGFLNSLGSAKNDTVSNNNLLPLSYGGMDNMHNWMSASRPMTPDFGMAGMMQQPSRSLWIGNFDPSTTAQELMNVFAVYGPIESLRLLPDKECGFINFVSVHDAVHAKDDIVNRLEGQINLKNGPTSIRIRFGKPESAPQTPASLLTTPLGTARGGNAGANGGLSQSMMMLSLTNIPGPNGIVSSSSINNICPNPSGYTTVGGIMLGPNGDPVLQSSPTRALWIGSIPSQTTPNHLMDIFSSYGAIESARVLSHKNCGFINFEHLDDAVRARKALSGREILGGEVGAVKIGYAKVPVKAPGTFSPAAQLDGLSPQDQLAQQQLAYDTLARMKGATAVPLDQQILSGTIQDYRSNLAMSFIPNGIHALNGFPLGGTVPGAAGFPLSTGPLAPTDTAITGEQDSASAICSAPLPPVSEMQLLMKELCRDPNRSEETPEEKESNEADILAVADSRPPVTYYTTVPPPINQLDPHRRLISAISDPSRLREIRKRFDSNTLGQEEMDQIANEVLEEIIYLSSDYIGNTIVQKLFEKCSHPIKLLMLERCAPHLAIIGCHKNGTWAAQKMIDCASTEEEVKMICQNLKPFAPPLLLDSLGNYVIQCCLRFGSPHNDYVFNAIVDRCWEVAQGRFGARSVRTCLESKYATPLQIKKVAIAVILNSIPLATNPNGTLLLTWLLDTSGLPGRYRLLAPRLAPHLSHLCTHKLASVTVLRIINQSVDPEASQAILDGIFHSSKQVLEEILGDQIHGINLLSKILTSPFINANQRSMMNEKIKDMLVSLRVQHIPAYKKLADEVGVSTTTTSGGPATNSGQGTPTRSVSATTNRSNRNPASSNNNSNNSTGLVEGGGTMWSSSTTGNSENRYLGSSSSHNLSVGKNKSDPVASHTSSRTSSTGPATIASASKPNSSAAVVGTSGNTPGKNSSSDHDNLVVKPASPSPVVSS